MAKIIDFRKKGNVVRFYLGRDDLEDWGGDDWNDSPYQYNAGEVYLEYISSYMDVVFPFNWQVLEPADSYDGLEWCKNDMKDKAVPCIVAHPDPGWLQGTFSGVLADQRAYKFYFGDDEKRFGLIDGLYTMAVGTGYGD